jgi:ferric-dicitrate binding protein FerR (iron transport regulator)
MSESVRKEYKELVNRYINGQASEEDVKLLELYDSLFNEELDYTDELSEEQLFLLQNRLKNNIDSGIKQPATQPGAPVIPLYSRTWFRVAAIVLIISAVAVMFVANRQNLIKGNNIASAPVAKKMTPAINKYVTLPDGSRVLIHAGSRIVINKDFTGTGNREITLVGEAYFDVKHNNKRKFIIHTGKIDITVLGTAFNVKAYPTDKNVTVTVTRGRVKVEKDHQLLAVLVPNKQLVADIGLVAPKTVERQVVAQQAIQWAGADMSFDNMPFSELAQHLDKRYDVQITFNNPNLESCPITGQFTGTESLKELLDILSATRGTTYKINGNNIVIDGKGCNGQ